MPLKSGVHNQCLERQRAAGGHTGRQGLRALVADVVAAEVELRQRAAGADRICDRFGASVSDVVVAEDERRQRIAGESMLICRKANTFVKDRL